MVIKIKRIKDVELPEKISVGDWIDLRCAEDIKIEKGKYYEIPLGIAMELPKGYEAYVLPRSSEFKKYGVIQVNSMAIIDNSFCGNNDEWKQLVLATRDTTIPKNERIAQFRITQSMGVTHFFEVDDLDNKDRGGIGSTGRN